MLLEHFKSCFLEEISFSVVPSRAVPSAGPVSSVYCSSHHPLCPAAAFYNLVSREVQVSLQLSISNYQSRFYADLLCVRNFSWGLSCVLLQTQTCLDKFVFHWGWLTSTVFHKMMGEPLMKDCAGQWWGVKVPFTVIVCEWSKHSRLHSGCLSAYI